MGLGKLLHKDGHVQRFLFALRPGARARAWWDLQRSQGYGSAYAQTWSPSKGSVKSTWDRVEEAQLAQEGITYIRPEQTELWREATKLLREQERSRADTSSGGQPSREDSPPPSQRRGRRWSPPPSESPEEGECDSSFSNIGSSSEQEEADESEESECEPSDTE